MAVRVPITNRARRFGYVIWSKQLEQDVERVLQGADRVAVCFMGDDAGEKRVDRKYRRISVGRRRTGALPSSAEMFVLTRADDGRLLVDVL